MINRIVSEIENSLRHDNFIAALALALALPDICGKAMFPREKPTQRYIKWCKECGDLGLKPPTFIHEDGTLDDMPYLNGEIIYSLRNSLFHQGSLESRTKVKEVRCQVDHIIFLIEKATQGTVSEIRSSGEHKTKRLYVNVTNLCMILTLEAKAYYFENKERFGFLSFDVQDTRKNNEDVLGDISLS